MRYTLDTEFSEDGLTILLISIGMVAEDGRELYLINSEAKKEHCNAWVQEHVWPKLEPTPTNQATRSEIRKQIEAFIGNDQKPEFWGYFADYDWCVFCFLWGSMACLPRNFPMYCLDLKQYAWHLGVSKVKELVLPDPNAHNALADAKWNMKLYEALSNIRQIL